MLSKILVILLFSDSDPLALPNIGLKSTNKLKKNSSANNEKILCWSLEYWQEHDHAENDFNAESSWIGWAEKVKDFVTTTAKWYRVRWEWPTKRKNKRE